MQTSNQDGPVFPQWRSALDAPRSRLFKGSPEDADFSRSSPGVFLPSQEALFTQSNARVLVGQAADGTFRLVALPTTVYPAPTGMHELGLYPGMYHHFDAVMYAGDLTYRVRLRGSEQALSLNAAGSETYYADHVFPLTRCRAGSLEMAAMSFAPVAADPARAALAPAPLPGPRGAFYVLHLRNTGQERMEGTVVLEAGDRLLGDYEDDQPSLRSMKRPAVDLRRQTLILSNSAGAAGVHLHEGTWVRLEAPFRAERSFTLGAGEEVALETHIAVGASAAEIMPVLYELHLHSALEWLNGTARFWRSRLGRLAVGAPEAGTEAELSRDTWIRCILDNFNCLQTDADGSLLSHWQGAPSHGFGTVWGIDIEPTAVSVMQVCPELGRQVMLFSLTRSRPPRGEPDNSIPILVAPLVIARRYLEASGDSELFRRDEVISSLRSIAEDLQAFRAPGEALFRSRYSSDGPVGRRYDFGTNVKVCYALDGLALILRQTGQQSEAARYQKMAAAVREAIGRTMVSDGPFGPQVTGGTNLNEAPAGFYLPEGVPYYDGEDTSSMLAPVYGVFDYTYAPWVNYHRFARSLWCPNFDPEFGVVRWSPGEFSNGALDGTAWFSRLGGSVTRAEMREALAALGTMGADGATGSVFWWPHGLEFRRSLTRCSQGQGAWAWQYLQQWLGVHVDAPLRTLTVAPRGFPTEIDWEGFLCGPARFDIHWREDVSRSVLRIRNTSSEPWTVRVGIRPTGTGADGAMAWQVRKVGPGQESTVEQSHDSQRAAAVAAGMTQAETAGKEAAALGDKEGIIFKRYGPARLWGAWDSASLWIPARMPLSARFVVVNGTSSDWTNVRVDLSLPQGWKAQGRQPMHWPQPSALSSGTVRLELGALPARERTVAAYWVQGPNEYNTSGINGAESFHSVSQPGPGILLPGVDVTSEQEVSLVAELSARAADGREIKRTLTVPVRTVPIASLVKPATGP